ncbi:alpha/beta hydrolase family protein [Alteromonas flava]|uniref:alpha/beta hydrolase family protein n=1 Tax=Alteromonas flava TaxID=2048003 RepID=UPI000C28DCC5|nr:prolyl oligopeptidase family serine peptidase [Alteromonas flava]
MKQLLFLLILVISQPVYADSATELTVEDFFKRPVVEEVALSPSGNMVAFEKLGDVFVGNPTTPYRDVYGVNSRYRVHRLVWLSDNVLAIQVRNKSNGKIMSVFFDLLIADGEISIQRQDFIDNPGYIVDRLPHQPDALLFAQIRFDDDKVFSDVHKVTLFTKKPYLFKKRKKYNYNSGEIIEWVTDQDSQLRVGVSYEDGHPLLWSRTSEKSLRMSSIWRGDKDTEISIYGISEDKQTLWAVTNYQRDTHAAVVFDLSSATIKEVLFEHPDRDVKGIIMDASRSTPLAVTYLKQGQLNYHFLNNTIEDVYNNIATQYPKVDHTVLNSSEDGSSMLLVQHGNTKPGTLIHCVNQGNTCSDVEDMYPWLNGVSLANTESFKTATEGEATIESFLSLPTELNGEGDSIPLIIMPHGGPIGVYDTSYLNGDVEWLVRQGYAVLRVNYRGSGGYGKAFEEQGMQQWGRAIEDDIAKAIADALQRFPQLDPDRSCLFGASYGGYSAVMSIIRSPEKFNCAISFAGVMDLPLLFNTSSVQNNEGLTQRLKEIIGDPVLQQTELMRYSPVFNAKQVKRPLMLIHGTKDLVVDVEHSWRMSRMLELYGIQHQKHILNGTGHSFRNTGEVRKFYELVIPFLEKHLQDNK